MKLHIAVQIMNLIDFISTAFYLRSGGQEANPFILWAMSLLGELQALTIIKITTGVLIYFIYLNSSRYMVAYHSLRLASIVYGTLTLWHLFVWATIGQLAQW